MSLVTPRKGYKSVPWLFGKEIEIPDEWEYGRIEHFCNKITSGGTPNRDNSEYYDGQIPWIKSGELKNNFLSKSEEKISEKGLSESSAKLFPKNTLLIAMYGATIGKTAILEKDATTNQAICAILPNTNFDSFYLQQLLISMKNILISFGMGAGQPNINQQIIKTFHIPLPPLPEQQKIASILSNVDNLIESTGKVITHSKKVKTGLMQELLTRGISHTKFKKVPWLFGKEIEIPEEWDFEKIKNISEKLVVGFVGTCEPYYVKKGGIPMLRTTNVKEGRLDLSNLKYVTEQFHNKNKKSQIKEKDLLISRHGESGESCLAMGLKEANCMNIVIVRAMNKILDNQYFEIIFNSLIVRKQIRRTTAGGVQGVVNTSEIAKVKIPIPPLPEQQKIATILSNVDDKITSQEQYKEKLERLKKSLMQKLLTGEVRV